MDLKSLCSIAKNIDLARQSTRREVEETVKSANSLIFPAICIPDNQLTFAFPWFFNGFLVHHGQSSIVIDPGYDFVSRCMNSQINPSSIAHIVVTHAHIDHYASLAPLIEYVMYFSKKPLCIWLPHNYADWSILPRYITEKKNLVIRTFNDTDQFAGADLRITPFPLNHSIDHTTGLLIEANGIQSLAYISDTGYTESVSVEGVTRMPKDCQGEYGEILTRKNLTLPLEKTDILICNINKIGFNKHSEYHLTLIELCDILRRFPRIKKCLVQHVNMISASHRELFENAQKVVPRLIFTDEKTSNIDISSA